jgi:phosphatidylserine/phosphatidylglycerophosphate/cardiolipin synthase-like enzyme
MGGVNYSRLYSGGPDGWYDAAIQWNDISPQRVNMMASLWHDEPQATPQVAGFVLHNQKLYEVIMDGITRAKQTIYMEQQYFASDGGKLYNNQIADAIVRRISRAYHANQPFHVTLITNRWFPHDSTVQQSMSRTLQHVAIQSLLSRVVDVVGIGALRIYLTIQVPTNPATTIHTKVYLFDQDRILLTSGNLLDASFNNDGHGELSWICENNPSVCNKLRSAIMQSIRQVDLSIVSPTKLSYPSPLLDIPISSSDVQEHLGSVTGLGTYLFKVLKLNMPIPEL